MSLSDPPPFDGRPYHLRMGLRNRAAEDWLERPPLRDARIDERRRLLAERHGDVFRALPGSEAAGAEAFRLVAAAACGGPPGRFVREAGAVLDRATGERLDPDASPRHPLDLAGRLAAEDLCLMERAEGEEAYRLTAASLCFPTRWRLADKIGRPLRAIHAPVPGFEAALAGPVERVFARLEPGRIVGRLNWSVTDDPALFQPSGHGRTGRDPSITPANAGGRLWLRTERQTLRRLPETGAVLFTIHVGVTGLDAAADDRRTARDLAATLRSMPAEDLAYKSLAPFLDALLAYLDRRAAGAPAHNSQ